MRIRDLSTVGTILDKTVSLGVNQGGDITFVNDDLKPGLAEARKRAVADALERARTLAEAAGVKLGRILAIEERPTRSGPMPLGKVMRAAAGRIAIEAVGFRDIHFAADDRLHAFFRERVIKADRTEQIAVIGNGNRRHFVFGSGLGERVVVARPVKQAETGMQVKMNEIIHRTSC